jgi:hypothetical protein
MYGFGFQKCITQRVGGGISEAIAWIWQWVVSERCSHDWMNQSVGCYPTEGNHMVEEKK